MKLPGNYRFAADAEMEVELSAQDLAGLTTSPLAPASPAPDSISSGSPHADVPAAAPVHAATTRMRISPRMLGATGAAAAAFLMIGGVILFSPPQRIVEAPVSNWSPVPDPVVEEVEQAPTLVANPFDASEVFELPPGLSRDEARAMVADLLLKRASERQVLSQQRS